MSGEHTLVLSAMAVGWVTSSGLSASVDHPPSDKVMTVFVTAAEVTQANKETETRLRAAMKEAQEKRKALEKSLKAQHGGKRDTWPQEVQDPYDNAVETEAIAVSDWNYRRSKPEELGDSAEDIKKLLLGWAGFGKSQHVTVVQTADEAQLIVVVDGRRKVMETLSFAACYVRVRIKAGPRLSDGRFSAVPKTYGSDGRHLGAILSGPSVVRLATPRADSPEWRFEFYGAYSWTAVAREAVGIINDFVEKNYDAMMSHTAGLL